jgi:CheY-like chemotaxis protein/DNA-binding XRE family transcriptional regulator
MAETNIFRRLREAQMWTKTELARKAGVSVLTVDRLEKGLPCRLSTQRKVLLALGLSLSEVRKLLDQEQAKQEAQARALESLAVPEGLVSGISSPFEGLSVLIVDDESGVRELLKGRLQHWGCRVDLASDGDEAVILYRAWRPDVVLMDLEMPGKTGIEAAEEILQLDPSASIILMTGAWDTSPARKALERKIVRLVLPKPFHVEQLEMALKEVAPKVTRELEVISKGGAVA